MITGVNHVTLAVAVTDRSFAFYRDTLGMTPAAKWDTGAYLSAGDLWLALIEAPDRAPPTGQDYTHLALSCRAEDFADLKQRIMDAGCAAWSENRSEGASHYSLDPDGHQLEIHVGDLQSRLAAMHENPWTEITFFDEDANQTGAE
ncbi:MAG: VOC family protein [Pseudomonadota bacterium]